mgnify:CR=1 FL=1
MIHTSDAGWSSLVARRAHNPKVVGSNPAPATKLIKAWRLRRAFFICARDCCARDWGKFKPATRDTPTRAAARTNPWAVRRQTALVCEFLTRILCLLTTAAGSGRGVRAMQDGLHAHPGNPRGNVLSKIRKSWHNKPTSLRTVPGPALFSRQSILRQSRSKDLNRQAPDNGVAFTTCRRP